MSRKYQKLCFFGGITINDGCVKRATVSLSRLSLSLNKANDRDCLYTTRGTKNGACVEPTVVVRTIFPVLDMCWRPREYKLSNPGFAFGESPSDVSSSM